MPVIQFSKMSFPIFRSAGSLVVGSWFGLGIFAIRLRSSASGFVVLMQGKEWYKASSTKEEKVQVSYGGVQ